MKTTRKSYDNASFVNVLDLECLTEGDHEIAQIGITVVNTIERKIITTVEHLVKPDFLERDYHWQFKRITKITKPELEQAKPLKEVLKLLKPFKIYHRPWACWGEDASYLNEELALKNLPLVCQSELDVQFLMSLNHKESLRKGLASALKLLKLEAQGTAHSAGSDSYNTAQILLKELTQNESKST